MALFFAVNGAKQGPTEEHKTTARHASWTNGLPEPLGTSRLERDGRWVAPQDWVYYPDGSWHTSLGEERLAMPGGLEVPLVGVGLRPGNVLLRNCDLLPRAQSVLG